MITAGNYEGQAIRGKVQLGETNTGTLQIAIDMELFDAKSQSIGQMTTFLYFSEGAAVYSYERLRLLGWKGAGPEDIDKLNDIFDTKVPVRVTAPESYKDPKDGTTKMGVSKLEIMAGAGTVTLAKPLDAGTFKARLRALGGGGGAPAVGSGGGNAPPF
jgi:hypothetical protein